MTDASRHRFWRRTLRLTAGLLATWLAVNLLVPWFARDLAGVQGFGFPVGYWLAAEGALLMYLAIIVVYVVAMDRLEARYRADIAAAGGDSAAPGPDPV